MTLVEEQEKLRTAIINAKGSFMYPSTDGSDFYLMVLSADGSELLYGTYYGSSGPEGDHIDGGTSRFETTSYD